MNSMTPTLDAPRAGLADDMTEDDNRRGFERDETDRFHQLVQQLVDDGDDCARSAGRQARRTLTEMDPGYQRQPVLLLTPAVTFRPSNGQCPLCERFNCGGYDCPPSAAPATTENSGQLQCDTCSGWFGFTGWTCPACQQLQGMTLPMRPTPHERDGRTEPPPAPARPHSAVPVRRQP